MSNIIITAVGFISLTIFAFMVCCQVRKGSIEKEIPKKIKIGGRMERLTEKDESPCTCCGGIGHCSTDCSYKQIYDRLAEYEDIGLEPEKIVFLKNVVDDAFSNKPEFTEHIRELLRAEKDGRLVILPCKVGERIYQVIPDYTAPDNSLFIEEDVFHLGLLTDGGELPANCYFTLEEAEKALAEEVCKENT